MRWTIWYSFKHGQVKTVQKWKWPTGLSVFWSGPVGKDSQNDLVLDERISAFSKWRNIFWVGSDNSCGICHEALADLKKRRTSYPEALSVNLMKQQFWLAKSRFSFFFNTQNAKFDRTLSDSRTDVATLLVGGKESTTGDCSSGQSSNKTLAYVLNWNEVILKYKCTLIRFLHSFVFLFPLDIPHPSLRVPCWHANKR